MLSLAAALAFELMQKTVRQGGTLDLSLGRGEGKGALG